MPKKDVLDVVFTDNTLPVIYPDALMSKGSLMLIDPGHSLGTFPAGVPAAGTILPNVAWETAKSILGAGDASSLGAVVSSSLDNAVFRAERSSKGGLHGISTQAGGQAASRFWVMNAAAAIRDYLYAHRADHQLYFSVWRRLTRPGIANASMQSPMHYTGAAGATSNYLFHGQNGRGYPLSGSAVRRGGREYPANGLDDSTAVGAGRFMNITILGGTGTGPDAAQNIATGVGAFAAWATANYNKAPSAIIYRAYVEDLTISGRTYAEVDALDFAMYMAAVETAGGKFYGDTWTDPATLLP